MPQVRSYGQLQGTVASKSLLPLDGKVDLVRLGRERRREHQGQGGRQDLLGAARPPDGPDVLQPGPVREERPQGPDHVGRVHGRQRQAHGAPASRRSPSAPRTTGRCRSCTRCSPAPRFGGKAFQGEVHSGQETSPTPTGSRSVEVVNDLAKFMPKNVTGVAQTDAQTLFTAEKAAMIPGGSFDLVRPPEGQPGHEDRHLPGAAGPGSPSGSTATTAGWADGNFAVSAKSKHPTEATELVKWMTTKEFGQMVDRRHQADLGRARVSSPRTRCSSR